MSAFAGCKGSASSVVVPAPSADGDAGPVLLDASDSGSETADSGSVLKPDADAGTPDAETGAPPCVYDCWRPLPPSGMKPREYAQAIWTGTEALIFGGYHDLPGGPDPYYGDGRRYDPASGTWRPMANGPATDSSGSSAWTGELVFLKSTFSFRSYNPAGDSWQDVAPPPVWGRVVWAGDRLFVWTSSAGKSPPCGATYFPSTKTWQVVPFDKSPVCPDSYRLVWTGSRVIVLGQSSADAAPQLGGWMYEPATGDWTPISSLGAPTGTAWWASAVWTGTDMIAWGSDGSAPAGGIFNPPSNTWRPVSLAGAVPGHSREVAWGDGRMFVWDESKQRGGIYDPDTDAWTSMSTAGAPPHMMPGPVVLWIGSELLVWGFAGGEDGAGRLYRPPPKGK